MVYNTVYELISTHIFDNVAVGSVQELACVLASTTIALVVLAVPFIVTWRVIRMFL